jgi:predicted secreted hydrolase
MNGDCPMLMKRRAFVARMLSLAAATPAALPFARRAQGAEPDADAFPPVVTGPALVFPDDEGSHPYFRIEWWYLTGWLSDGADKLSGFQITFFRSRPQAASGNPSRFAPHQIFVAHIALADPRRGKLLYDQRIARGVFGLAAAAERVTDVSIGDWRLSSKRNTLVAVAAGRELAFDLTFTRKQQPLLHGDRGVSKKGPAEESASYYYTLPQLEVSGSVATAPAKGKGSSAGTFDKSNVTGRAWLDHEWSSASMEAPANGWDWIGLNLDDGGALMAFRIRSPSRANFWSGGTLRSADGTLRTFSQLQVAWLPAREWRSARTGAVYPVEWNVRIDQLLLRIEPLMDDQELDARATTGTIYWEGAVTAQLEGREIGRGYLEMTGYWRSFRV